jgi:polygalacturonase
MRYNRVVALVTIAAVLMACPFSGAQSPATQPSLRVPITQFSAVGDGTTLNTQAIQKAIDQVASSGGGTVVIPQGVFLSGSIFLGPGVNLHLEKDAVLKGTTNIADYPKMETRIEGHFQQWIPALVNADKVDHLRITGEGTLDGSGQPFWAAFRTRIVADRTTKNLDVERPRLMFIRDSKDVLVSGIHFKDSGFWNLHIYRCDGVVVDGLDIVAGPGSPSTDGMDIDSSQNVTIRNCHIAVNDDCIALKGTKGPLAMEDKDSPPVEHVRVSNCAFERGASFVTCGSEATIVRDVIVENCRAVGNASRGMSMLKLKLRADTPQLYEDIHFRQITLEGTGALISIAPWLQYFDLQGHPQPTRTVRNVTVSDVKGSFGSFGSIRGNQGDTIEKVLLENIDVKLTGPAPRLEGVKDLVVRDVKINGEAYIPAGTPAPASAP